MDPWLARAERLCYEGEEVRESVRLGGGGIVVTTHRVLAFSPEREGANFRQADRPNVEGVRRDDGGDGVWLVRGGKALVVGAVLVVAGSVVDLGGLVGGVSTSGAGRIGLGGVAGAIQGLLDVLAMLDDLVLLAGGLALLAGAGLLGNYARTREPTLRVEVAGDDDLTVPADPWPETDVVDHLDRTIAPGGDATATGDRPADAPVGDDPLA